MAHTSTLTDGQEYPDPTEIDARNGLSAITFSTDGEHLLSGGKDGIQKWRVEDGKQTAAVEMSLVWCLATSRNGRWSAVGTRWDGVSIWDAKAHKQVDSYTIAVHAVDFSPDSSRLVCASGNGTVTIWDVATRKQVVTLYQGRARTAKATIAAKYSPRGDQIATATQDSIRVFSNHGRLLVDIKVNVTAWYNAGLVWFDDHLLVISGGKIKQIEASSGSTVSEWSVPDGDEYSCIALPQHGRFIVYSTKHTVTLWDISTHTQLGLVHHPQNVRSIAISPDDQSIAIGGEKGKIIIQALLQTSTCEQGQQDEPSTLGDHDNSSVLVGVAFEQGQEEQPSIPGDHDDDLPEGLACEQVQEGEQLSTSGTHDDNLLDSTPVDFSREQGQEDEEPPPSGGHNDNPPDFTPKDPGKPGLVESELSSEDRESDLLDLELSSSTPPSQYNYDETSSPATFSQTLVGEMLSPSSSYPVPPSSGVRLLTSPPGTPSGKTTKNLPRVADPVPLSCLHPTFREPDFQVDDVTLDLWKQDHLTNAEALLTAAIVTSQNASHHLLASRALVRGRLGEWNMALVDAEMAIQIQPSIIGYIAKSVALVGRGEKHKGYRTCDIAFARLHSSHVNFLLLVKAVIVFMAGEHLDAISRIDDLIATVPLNSICYVIQAHMYLLRGNSRMECNDYEGAIQLFERARAQMRQHTSRLLVLISLISGWKFDDLSTKIRQRLCEALYAASCTKDAVDCYHQMTNERGGETNLHGEHLEWGVDFSRRLREKLEQLGDTAMEAQRHDEAISHYTTALSLHSPSPQGILIKRSNAFVATGAWQQALDDANRVIMLDPSLPWGYEMKHAALHRAGDHENAVDAFETMLLKIAQSPNPHARQHGDQYISPSSTRATIRRIVQRTTRHLPRVLINTTTGYLHDRTEQATAFESLPIFNELISSMTTRIDYGRIKREVRQYFRYVMLSHKWEENEPLFQQVIHIAVYDLDDSPTHDKLKMFCTIVRDAGFNWAWCDTCCIDKSDHFILQEALVAMFKWYQGSAMMIVFLRGVRSPAQLGALMGSVWNTRAWTLQEYVAAKVIHFYTEDWALYLDLELMNHKESPEVALEMENATGVSAQQLMALRPGLTNIREKLRLASTRQTTLVEDAAYSLLGIFSVAGLSAIYGEGEGALGRLLAHVLTGSGDISILAWTGESSSYNSCLPAHITVFNGPATSHVPSPIPDAEMERIIAASQSSSFDLDTALNLYDRLNELPVPWFAASRMKLPCIAFELPPLSPYRTRSGRVYRADTVAFGTVDIKTRHDLSRMKSLYLVHPWLDALLEREDIHISAPVEDDVAPPPSPNTDDEEAEIFDDEFDDESPSAPELGLPSHPPPVHTIQTDREMRARRLVARLRQPFGPLLVTLASTGRRAMDYRRVAADSLFTVQFQEGVSLADILDNVRTLDVL